MFKKCFAPIFNKLFKKPVPTPELITIYLSLHIGKAKFCKYFKMALFK